MVMVHSFTNINKRTIISHLNHWLYKRPRHISLEIKSWDRHKHVAGL